MSEAPVSPLKAPAKPQLTVEWAWDLGEKQTHFRGCGRSRSPPVFLWWKRWKGQNNEVIEIEIMSSWLILIKSVFFVGLVQPHLFVLCTPWRYHCINEAKVEVPSVLSKSHDIREWGLRVQGNQIKSTKAPKPDRRDFFANKFDFGDSFDVKDSHSIPY